MKKKLIFLFGIMLLLVIASNIIIKLSMIQTNNNAKPSEKIQIVTSFYPVYMIGVNLAEQQDSIEVNSLTDLNTGCLHDYQLTTQDMKLIANADILIINGGGMEGFLEDVSTNYPNLTIINASENISMLPANVVEHSDGKRQSGQNQRELSEDGALNPSRELNDHGVVNSNGELNEHSGANSSAGSNEHGGANSSTGSNEHGGANSSTGSNEHGGANSSAGSNEHSGEKLSAGSNEHGGVNSSAGSYEHGGMNSHGEWNAHVWLEPSLYIQQIENVKVGMEEYIKKNNSNSAIIVQAIEENAKSYIKKISTLDHELNQLADNQHQEEGEGFQKRKAIIFHDSFAYLADSAGMEIVDSIPLDSDTALSAGDIAEIIRKVKAENIRYLFTEEQYSDSIAKQIENETDAKVYIIDSAVTGDGSKDSYLNAMKKNIEVLRQALEK